MTIRQKLCQWCLPALSLLSSPTSFATLNDGLVSYFDFNNRVSSNNHLAVTSSGSPSLTTDRNDNENSAIEFVRGFSVRTNLDSTAFNDQMAYSFWFKSNYNESHSRCSNYYSSYASYILSNETHHFAFCRQRIVVDGKEFTSEQLINGIWRHIVVNYDQNAISVYVDGLFQAQFSSNTFSFGDGRLMFGKQSSTSSSRYAGKLDDVRIYNRTLSEAEVVELAQLNDVSPPTPSSEDCWAVYDGNNLSIPCVKVVDSLGGENKYNAKFRVIPFRVPPSVELLEVTPK